MLDSSVIFESQLEEIEQVTKEIYTKIKETSETKNTLKEDFAKFQLKIQKKNEFDPQEQKELSHYERKADVILYFIYL